MIELVFFDAGETILHPHPSFAELFADTCAAHGHPVSRDKVAAVQASFGRHMLEVAYESGVENPSLSPDKSREFWTHLYRRLLRELDGDEAIADELYAVFSNSASYRLFDDVLPTFEHLERAGYRLGLISNFEGWLEKLLVELNVGHVFDVTVISAAEGIEKPDPRLYEIALERAGVAPEATVHVGDSTRFDVEPALAVGMHAVLLDRYGRHRSDSVPCRTIGSLQELPSAIAKIAA